MNRKRHLLIVHITIPIAVLLTASVLASLEANAAIPVEVPLQSKTIKGPLPIADPNSSFWRASPSIRVPLAWQNITKPMLLGPSIRSLHVRSINNGTWIAFLVEWDDKTRSATTFGTERFRDAVAIMFPVKNEAQPPFLGMGEVNKPVNIWHWKGDWQEDIDNMFQDLEKAHPNVWVNYYPFSKGNQSYPVTPLINQSKAFISGWAAGNPLSNPNKLTPVEDLIAEGFGTLTHESQQDVTGNGLWENGVWKVVLARPITTSDTSDVQFQPGLLKHIAFAVWEGGNREVDGRKSFSNWHTLKIETGLLPEVEEGALVPVSLWRWIVVGVVFLLSVSILFVAGNGGLRRRSSSWSP